MSDLVGNPEDRFSRVAAHIFCDKKDHISSVIWLILSMKQGTGEHREKRQF